MQRFYVSFPLSIDLTLEDTGLVHQISRVMRMQLGEHIVLFDGDGSETEYEIISFTKRSISLRGLGRAFPKTELSQEVTLYQALPNKYEKIEYILEKGVEIGIRRFVFFRSDRSQKLLISPSKIQRFHTIVKEALEQCGWVTYPEVHFLDRLDLDAVEVSPVYVLHTSEVHAASIGVSSRTFAMMIGPEGGWSPEEIQKMSDKGYIFVHLWDRVLRTETAGIVAVFSLIQRITPR